jgi:hypothetical protein
MDELDPPDRAALESLRSALAADKPAGWSVVRGLRELVLRPPNRQAGKVGIRVRGGVATGAFHDRGRGVWTEHREWAIGPATAAAILAWATELAGDPIDPEAPPNVR